MCWHALMYFHVLVFCRKKNLLVLDARVYDVFNLDELNGLR